MNGPLATIVLMISGVSEGIGARVAVSVGSSGVAVGVGYATAHPTSSNTTIAEPAAPPKAVLPLIVSARLRQAARLLVATDQPHGTAVAMARALAPAADVPSPVSPSPAANDGARTRTTTPEESHSPAEPFADECLSRACDPSPPWHRPAGKIEIAYPTAKRHRPLIRGSCSASPSFPLRVSGAGA
jgi:glycerol uptake facilitator-like aquaporin